MWAENAGLQWEGLVDPWLGMPLPTRFSLPFFLRAQEAGNRPSLDAASPVLQEGVMIPSSLYPSLRFSSLVASASPSSVAAACPASHGWENMARLCRGACILWALLAFHSERWWKVKTVTYLDFLTCSVYWTFQILLKCRHLLNGFSKRIQRLAQVSQTPIWCHTLNSRDSEARSMFSVASRLYGRFGKEIQGESGPNLDHQWEDLLEMRSITLLPCPRCRDKASIHTAINHKADFISAEVSSKGFEQKHSDTKSDR